MGSDLYIEILALESEDVALNEIFPEMSLIPIFRTDELVLSLHF